MQTPDYGNDSLHLQADWQLVKGDDARAFQRLYAQTVVMLTNECFRVLRDADAVQDVLQEVYASVYQRRHELPDDTNIGGYLRSAVRYRTIRFVRDRWRREQQETVTDLVALEAIPAHRTPAELTVFLDTAEEQTRLAAVQHRLREVVTELPEKCREAFVLSHYQQLSYRKISDKMGISVKTVEKHVSKALQVLRRELKEDASLEWAIILLGLGLL